MLNRVPWEAATAARIQRTKCFTYKQLCTEQPKAQFAFALAGLVYKHVSLYSANYTDICVALVRNETVTSQVIMHAIIWSAGYSTEVLSRKPAVIHFWLPAPTSTALPSPAPSTTYRVFSKGAIILQTSLIIHLAFLSVTINIHLHCFKPWANYPTFEVDIDHTILWGGVIMYFSWCAKIMTTYNQIMI